MYTYKNTTKCLQNGPFLLLKSGCSLVMFSSEMFSGPLCALFKRRLSATPVGNAINVMLRFLSFFLFDSALLAATDVGNCTIIADKHANQLKFTDKTFNS